MKKIVNAVKNAFKAYCENNYKMNKAVYDAGLILMWLLVYWEKIVKKLKLNLRYYEKGF